MRVPQAPRGAAAPGPPQALSRALRPYQFFLAEHARTLLSRSDGEAHPACVFHSVAELKQAIREYIDEHNRKPKPYLWTAKARDILEKVKRAWTKLRAGGFVPKSGKFAALDSIDLRLAAEGSSDS